MTLPRNLIGGVATIAIGAAYLFMASSIRTSALDDAVGPAGFPKALAYALLGLGLILCLQSLWAIRARRAVAGAQPAGTDEDHGVRGLLRAAGMLALGIVYLLIVRWLGYVPSIALLIIASALYLGTPFSWRVVAIGVAGAIAYWVVFVWLLGIPQPSGLLAGLF
jgi:putative tricarboxylic transport membrane protein